MARAGTEHVKPQTSRIVEEIVVLVWLVINNSLTWECIRRGNNPLLSTKTVTFRRCLSSVVLEHTEVGEDGLRKTTQVRPETIWTVSIVHHSGNIFPDYLLPSDFSYPSLLLSEDSYLFQIRVDLTRSMDRSRTPHWCHQCIDMRIRILRPEELFTPEG